MLLAHLPHLLAAKCIRILFRYGLDSLYCVLSAIWGGPECPECWVGQAGDIWWLFRVPAQWSLQRPQTAWYPQVSTKHFSCCKSVCVLIKKNVFTLFLTRHLVCPLQEICAVFAVFEKWIKKACSLQFSFEMCDYTWGKADELLHLSVDYSSVIIRESKVFLGLQKVCHWPSSEFYNKIPVYSILMDTELV